MAKKTNKPDAPQQTAGAADNTEQVNPNPNPDEKAGTATSEAPQESAGAPDATAPADGNAAGAAAGDATETPAKPKKAAEPKVSDAVAKIGKNLLKNNPDMSVVYMTADGRGFYEKNDAELHARNLTNKAVTPVKK